MAHIWALIWAIYGPIYDLYMGYIWPIYGPIYGPYMAHVWFHLGGCRPPDPPLPGGLAPPRPPLLKRGLRPLFNSPAEYGPYMAHIWPIYGPYMAHIWAHIWLLNYNLSLLNYNHWRSTLHKKLPPHTPVLCVVLSRFCWF